MKQRLSKRQREMLAQISAGNVRAGVQSNTMKGRTLEALIRKGLVFADPCYVPGERSLHGAWWAGFTCYGKPEVVADER